MNPLVALVECVLPTPATGTSFLLIEVFAHSSLRKAKEGIISSIPSISHAIPSYPTWLLPTPLGHIVGCLLDVSGSMKSALETGRGDERAIDRLHAVLRAALKLAQAEQSHAPNSLIFVGIFGLNTDGDYEHPPTVDLCGVIEDLLLGIDDNDPGRTGHSLLSELANQNNVAHISEYILTKLTDDEARLVYAHIRKHPNKVAEFVNMIPSPIIVRGVTPVSSVGGAFMGSWAGPLGVVVGGVVGGLLAEHQKNSAVDNSEALKMARRIRSEWLWGFIEHKPRPVADVVRLLQRLGDSINVSRRQGSGNAQGSWTLPDSLFLTADVVRYSLLQELGGQYQCLPPSRLRKCARKLDPP